MKEIDGITIDTSDKNSEVEEVDNTVNYNFIRKKRKSISMEIVKLLNRECLAFVLLIKSD